MRFAIAAKVCIKCTPCTILQHQTAQAFQPTGAQRSQICPARSTFAAAVRKINARRTAFEKHHPTISTDEKLLLPFFCFPFLGLAQDLHFSVRLGAAGYHGDLTQHSINIKGAKPLLSLGGRADLSEHLAARLYFSFSALQADDKRGTADMKARNLNFKTGLFEGEFSGQYNLFSLNDRWWTPYLFAGVGVFHFNPYTSGTNKADVFLQPLSTEGQGIAAGTSTYKLTQPCLPFGFGAEYSLNEDMRLGLEVGYRKLFTDYLDDVSTNYVDQAVLLQAKGQQAVDFAWRGDEVNGAPYPPGGTQRGNPTSKDGYYYVAITYTVRTFFNSYKAIAGIPSGKRDKKLGCPATRF